MLYTQLFAEDKPTCIEKLEHLKKLEEERKSSLERAVTFTITQDFASFSKNYDDKLRDEKIRVLKIELKSCK